MGNLTIGTMNGTSTNVLATDREALESLVIDNPDLERLEALLDRFNLFEALGIVRQELRHSDLLAFILDPRQPHGLGDAFLKAGGPIGGPASRRLPRRQSSDADMLPGLAGQSYGGRRRRDGTAAIGRRSRAASEAMSSALVWRCLYRFVDN
jgi:hypothetical protein